jgi:capsular polysaccharide biosynthesis protein
MHFVKTLYHSLRSLIFRILGIQLLGTEATIAFMQPYQVKAVSSNSIALPDIINGADGKTIAFKQKEAVTNEVFVWDYQDNGKNAAISKFGSVVVKKHVLSTDYNYSSFYRDIWKKDKRTLKKLPAAMALFSQFQDGVMYGGYYDFVFLVACKLSRIKDVLSPDDFAGMPVIYPLFGGDYETEYMQLLGVDPVNLVDSRKFKVDLSRVVTANSARWYPNLYDVQSLKQNIEKRFEPEKTELKRIYISRKGRRHVTNEAEVIEMLKTFNFTIIEDKPRTVTEQISLYHNASFILGPHGASFSNIIWCQPGTHLMELFSSNYVPDFFLYLAKITGMEYSAFYEELPQKTSYLDALVEDIHVAVAQLEACLTRIFNQE